MTQTLYRAVTARATKVSDRVRRFVMSTGDVALDGHTIDPLGWDLSRAPFPMPWAHDVETIGNMLGNWTNVRVDGDALVGDANFMDADTNPLADTALRMVDGKWIRNCSVGFVPTEYKPSNRGPGCMNITRALLLECSLVPVPSDAGAVAAARAAGIDTMPIAAWAERALDEGKSRMSQDQLTAIRRAAGGAAPKVYPMPRASGGAFRGVGEMAKAIVNYRAGGVEDARLTRAPTGMGELDPSGGGFLVDSVLADQLLGSIYEASAIAPLCARVTTTDGKPVKIPAVDETSRADGSRWGGAAAYWAAEAASVSASFPKSRQIEFSQKKIISVVYATEELLEDVAMLEAHLTRAVASEIGFKIDQAILSGTGAGQPVGLLNSSALITVAKANGQAAATIVKENINSMWSRLPAPSRKNAVWLMNEDAMAQIDTGASNYQGVYAEPENGERFPRLKGAPVLEIEQAPALGTLGDILLFDPTQYLLVGSEMKTAISMDVQFLTHQVVFRFVMRIDGAPLWASAITPYNGSGITRSPYVALGAR